MVLVLIKFLGQWDSPISSTFFNSSEKTPELLKKKQQGLAHFRAVAFVEWANECIWVDR